MRWAADRIRDLWIQGGLHHDRRIACHTALFAVSLADVFEINQRPLLSAAVKGREL